jgi:hypothetical protein
MRGDESLMIIQMSITTIDNLLVNHFLEKPSTCGSEIVGSRLSSDGSALAFARNGTTPTPSLNAFHRQNFLPPVWIKLDFAHDCAMSLQPSSALLSWRPNTMIFFIELVCQKKVPFLLFLVVERTKFLQHDHVFGMIRKIVIIYFDGNNVA